MLAPLRLSFPKQSRLNKNIRKHMKLSPKMHTYFNKDSNNSTEKFPLKTLASDINIWSHSLGQLNTSWNEEVENQIILLPSWGKIL